MSSLLLFSFSECSEELSTPSLLCLGYFCITLQHEHTCAFALKDKNTETCRNKSNHRDILDLHTVLAFIL